MKLHFTRKVVYGLPYDYPVEKEFSAAHSLLTGGRKTIDANHIEGYDLLGIKLEERKPD